MQGMHLYEYAVIRLVPKVEREEFINVGIILFSKHARYIKVRYQIDEERIKSFFQIKDPDLEEVYAVLDTFIQVSEGTKKGGRIAQLDIPERFRWLTSVRSTIIQTSRPHPGFSADLDNTLNCLFKELVL